MEHELEEWNNEYEGPLRHCKCTCARAHYEYHHNLDNLDLDVIRTLPADYPLPPWMSNGGVIAGGNFAISEPTFSSQHVETFADDRTDSDSNSRTSHKDLGRKQWYVLCVAVLIALVAGVGVGVPLALRSTASAQERLQLAHQILSQVPLIDGHNDLPWNVRKFVGGKLSSLNLAGDLLQEEPWSRSPWSHTDLPKLREGGVGAQFWAAYVPCGAQFLDAVKLTLEQIDLIKRMVLQHSQYLLLVTSAKGIEEAHSNGLVASLIGVEGGHSIGYSLGVLRTLYDLGARYLTLTHTCSTPWADCSFAETDPQQNRNGGLSPFGKAVIREMNRLGMIVDLSHVSASTMHDAIDSSKAPVIFSHSSARALCNTSRNVPDDVLRKLQKNGGIVMVNFFTYFITCNKTATISDVIAHINHIRNVVGVDHVGIGAGYDGINSTPRGLQDVSRYPALFAELLQDPRWTVDDLKKLAGGNFLRVFYDVEKIRDNWKRANVAPDETVISQEELRGQTQCSYIGS